ncbi:hypothetical protein OAD04_05510 [Schleiferiaceae bacterium]|jgi:hypothetical protein|nr:hypothetical protein [Schleiferiaceae bacterium]
MKLVQTHWIFCLSAKEPKRGPCTQTKAVGSWRCTASFFIEPSWKQASELDFLPAGKRTKSGALVPKQQPLAAALHYGFFHGPKLEASFRLVP